MKLPTKEQIAQQIRSGLFSQTYRRDGSDFGWTETGYLLDADELERAAERIIELIKIEQFEETSEEAEAEVEVDPNLIRIAELEAKLAIYEAVVAGAGIKLALPEEKREAKRGVMAHKSSPCASAKNCVAERLNRAQAYMIRAFSFGELEIAPGVFLIRYNPYEWEDYSPEVNKHSDWR